MASDLRGQHQARCKGRCAAAFDLSISSDAVRLYLAIDEHAGHSGVAWPRQSRLMTMTGFSRAEFYRKLAELRGKHLTVTKDRRRAIYTLQWVSALRPIGANRSQDGDGKVSPVTPIGTSILYEPVLIEPVLCEICEDHGWKADPAMGRIPCECEAGAAIRERLSRRKRA